MTSPLAIIGRQVMSYGIGLAATRLLSLLALPILTSYLSAFDYGLVMLLAVLGVVIRMVFGVGSSGAAGIVYFRHEAMDARVRVIWGLAFLLFFGGLGGVVIPQLLFQEIRVLFFQDASEITRTVIFCFTSGMALQLMSEAFLLNLQFTRDARRYALISVTGAVAGIGASIWLVAVADMGIEGWVYGQLFGSAILLAMAYKGTRKVLGPPEFDWCDAKDLVRVWTPLLPGGIAVMVMMNAGPYFVGKLTDITTAGHYGVGYQLGMGMALATSAVASAWMPFFQGFVNRQGEAGVIFPKLVQTYLAGMGGLTLLFFVFAYPVVSWLIPIEYRDAWQVVGLVAMGQMLMGLWGMLLPGMYYAGETGWVTVLQIAASIVTALVFIATIGNFGLIGGGGMVVGLLCLIALQLLTNHWRNYHITVIDPPKFFGILTLLLISCALVWFAWWGNPNGMYAWGLSLVVVSAYLLVAVLAVRSMAVKV